MLQLWCCQLTAGNQLTDGELDSRFQVSKSNQLCTPTPIVFHLFVSCEAENLPAAKYFTQPHRPDPKPHPVSDQI